MNCKSRLILIFCSLLTGCGYGYDATNSGGNPGATSPTVTPANLQVAVEPTYALGTEERNAFNEINSFRQLQGLGPWVQSLALDSAEKQHMEYRIVNSQPVDTEIVGYPSFRGATASDRALAANYGSQGAKELSAHGLGLSAIRTMENSVYHRSGLMNQISTDVGIAFSSNFDSLTSLSYGFIGQGQNNASDFISVYPRDNQTDIQLSMGAESPNPIVDITDNNFQLKTTVPISIASAFGTSLTVTSFTVTPAGFSTPLDARILTFSNDPNSILGSHEVYLIGRTPFTPKTSYNVVFSGIVNGTPINKNWSFTTGTAIN